MLPSPYKKGWLVTTGIAKMLLGAKEGDRIPTVQECVDQLHISRGMVQNALQTLREEGAITLEKRGNAGTFILSLDQSVLFRLADIHFITASMPIPFFDGFSGLASGVSFCMDSCPVPFNFAFVPGAGNRVDALRRGVYDFVVLSRAAAAYHVTADPSLELMMTLENSSYAEPFVFCSRGEAITEPRDGMTIAADPNATDQFQITQQLCRGKDIKLLLHTFVSCRALFLEGEADCVVYYKNDWTQTEGIWTHPLPTSFQSDFYTPAILARKSDQAIGQILYMYLQDDAIARIQKQVVNREIQPQF